MLTGWAFVSEPLSPDRLQSLMGHSGVKAGGVRTVLPGAKIKNGWGSLDVISFKDDAQTALFKDPVRTAL